MHRVTGLARDGPRRRTRVRGLQRAGARCRARTSWSAARRTGRRRGPRRPSSTSYVRPDGRLAWLQCRASVNELRYPAGDRPCGWSGTVQDITEQKEAEDALAHQALHDGLTGLPNRALLLDRLDRALADTRRGTVAVVFMDLDRFKWVNDSLSHAAGDQLLIAVAERLPALLRPSDTLARLGGDEFVLVCEHLDLRAAGASPSWSGSPPSSPEPFVIEGRELRGHHQHGRRAGARPGSRSTPEALIRDADTAHVPGQGERPGPLRDLRRGDAAACDAAARDQNDLRPPWTEARSRPGSSPSSTCGPARRSAARRWHGGSTPSGPAAAGRLHPPRRGDRRDRRSWAAPCCSRHATRWRQVEPLSAPATPARRVGQRLGAPARLAPAGRDRAAARCAPRGSRPSCCASRSPRPS